MLFHVCFHIQYLPQILFQFCFFPVLNISLKFFMKFFFETIAFLGYSFSSWPSFHRSIRHPLLSCVPCFFRCLFSYPSLMTSLILILQFLLFPMNEIQNFKAASVRKNKTKWKEGASNLIHAKKNTMVISYAMIILRNLIFFLLSFSPLNH